MVDGQKNIAASVRQRLQNLSRLKKRDFGLILVNYGLERLIFRLSVSPFRDRFVLKGGMLVTLWTGDEARTTRDADFLGFGELDEENLKAIFTEIMGIQTEDGLIFDTVHLTIESIREDQIYGGARLKTIALLEKARIPITIDIGLGDALTNPDYIIDYPSMLNEPIANLRAYPPETVIAEKFQAIVALGLANGRMKNYYDLWALPSVLTIEPAALDSAIFATFERRKTGLPTLVPPGLAQTFFDDPQKKQQWVTYAASIGLDGVSLEHVVSSIWAYLGPSCDRLNRVR
ncbi:nucleotidyl transferase AbiEii/AbiGii toxin family protein [Aquidulcibacter paucihalophilus]|uniref:nucleotidyl transferase AbiEii/AbiGii toxin family protein n=1 Tax=Aquidulcibacter paucihalophilus TaxID=1978549 RepID=UPI000A1942F5|nr:nucleotidyl transferase AbiEii/AbiGii toxin family protein [Aquidulcibacter paucihalophilus]